MPLTTFLTYRALHAWILARTPPLRVLGAIGPQTEGAFAATLDGPGDATKTFLDEIPRGRGLSAANKGALHRLAKLLGKDLRFEALFAVTFDTPANLDRMIGEKRIEQNPDGTYSFVYLDQIDLYPHTILHEVGHAVDYMLGAQTQLIYELAGWKKFQHGDFDGWAASLGGWDLVSAPDKKDITKAWTSWLAGGAKGTLSALVGADHPAVAARYAKVGVVELATQDITLSFTPTNGQYAMVNHAKQAWMTISQKGYNASPSTYALTAPEEYFAECYANYYRELTAAPASNLTKGATLVPWIKSWFDTNIDKAGHPAPRRPPLISGAGTPQAGTG